MGRCLGRRRSGEPERIADCDQACAEIGEFLLLPYGPRDTITGIDDVQPARLGEAQSLSVDAAAGMIERRFGDVTLFYRRSERRLSVTSRGCNGHGFPLRHCADPVNVSGRAERF
jgi:hypothetical protein